jgi:hypothetical protein
MSRSKSAFEPEQLHLANEELRSKLREAEKKPDAIRNGDVGALVLSLEKATKR